MDQVLVILVIFVTVYKVIELFVHRKERLQIIENTAANNAVDNDKLQEMVGSMQSQGFRYFRSGKYQTLRIALLVVGVALGLVVSGILEMLVRAGDYCRFPDALEVAFPCLFGGLGLLAAYLEEQRDERRKEEREASRQTPQQA